MPASHPTSSYIKTARSLCLRYHSEGRQDGSLSGENTHTPFVPCELFNKNAELLVVADEGAVCRIREGR